MIKTQISDKEIWRIAYPIMIGNLAQTVITFTDTAFLGHLGVHQLSASMMAGLFYYVFTTLAMGFAVGIQIIIARRFGEGHFDKIGLTFGHGAIFVFLIGLLMFCIIFFFSPQLLLWIIESKNIYAFSLDYISVRQFGIFFVCFNYLFRSFYVGISNTKTITYSTIIMAVVNIFLDYSLIFGNFGFPEMGIKGAAAASMCAEFSALVFFIAYTYIKIPHQEYKMFVRFDFDRELTRNIFKIATPTMVQRLFSFGVWFVFFVLIEKMGEMAIGVSSMVRSVYMVLIIPAFAFGSTANTLTSRLIGEGHADQVHSMLLKVLKNSMLCCLPLVIALAIFPMEILKVYTNDMELATLAVPALYVICIATLCHAFGVVYFEAVSGTGNTNAALFLEFGILVIYVYYIWRMTITSTITVVWTAENLYALLIGLVSIIYLRFVNWQKRAV